MSDRDWDDVLSKFSGSEPVKKRPRFEVGAMLGALATFNVIIALNAFLIMIANMVAIDAWPLITAIMPGIGFKESYVLSMCGWCFFIIVYSVLSVLRESNANR